MKLFWGLMSLLILSASVSHAQESQPRAGYYNDFLAAIQNSDWKGTFFTVAGPAACYGTLDVKFFAMQAEPFSNGVPTVSYRHHAQFSPLNPFFVFCQTLGKALSSVDVGSCDGIFPKKPAIENGQNVMVPFRTIIPRDSGARVVLSTPYCFPENGGDGTLHAKVGRMEYQVTQLEFTDDLKRNAMKMRLIIDAVGLPVMVANYNLERVGP
jgi:hypothetical protein